MELSGIFFWIFFTAQFFCLQTAIAADHNILLFIPPILAGHSGHVPTTRAKAASFLARATFGPKMAEINRLAASGSYDRWLKEQFAAAPSYHLAWMRARLPGIAWKKYSDLVHTAKKDAWWDIVVHGNDQLRQRVAFALSEIMVVSQYGPLINEPDGLASYYDLLVKNAFGNFRTLIKDVTLNPMMGKYLSYHGNAKADPATGNHPDENYAREVMQLFTIGLYRMNQDGTTINDSVTGVPLPTYTQDDIREMARIFTGWTNDNGFFFVGDGSTSHHARTAPMVADEEYHDTGVKHILGHSFPAGQTTEQDLDMALDLLFNHPNVGPFIARRLIQRLVSSNPSSAYISRVAAAFNNNGHGVRGDMKAVVKAILLDPEALNGAAGNPQTFGKVREPLLCISHLWRSFDAQNGLCAQRGEDETSPVYHYNCFNFSYARSFLQQNAPLESLTVFNYFTPDDGPADLKKQNLVAPETMVLGIDGLHSILLSFILETYTYEVHEVKAHLQVGTEVSMLLSGRYDDLVERLNILLLSGRMSPAMKQLLLGYIHQHVAEPDKDFLARNLIALVMLSSQYAVQR
jgi:uncharacterized protein (DUF1800 family)